MSDAYADTKEACRILNHMAESRKEECEKLRAELAKYQWVSVKDRVPDDHEDVLVWFEYFRYGDYNCLFQRYGIGNHVDKTWIINGETGWKQLRVIAWQKLPEPPKE